MISFSMNTSNIQDNQKSLKINSVKTLYHGTNVRFNTIDLKQCNRFKDFGQGYYLTTDLRQAQRWAQIKAGDTQTAYIYSYNLATPVSSDLKILELLEYNSCWVEFIVQSRFYGKETDYDIIYDRIADNRGVYISQMLERSMLHTADAEEVIEHIKWKQGAGDQYCFKTASALSLLINERCYITYRDNKGRWRKPVKLEGDEYV